MKIHFTLFTCLLLFVGLVACNHQNAYNKTAASLLLKSKQLNQEYQHINAHIENLWDSTSALLACELPAELPPIDRNIFINSRSAYHIRMFMSYKNLNTHIHSIVNAAALKDELLRDQLHKHIKLQQDFENQKNKFLTDISKHDMTLYHLYSEKFQNISVEIYPARSITKIN